MSRLTIRRPPALRAGDTVAVVAPSGPVRPERIAQGLALLESWGLTVVPGAEVYARHGYLAGTDTQRGAALAWALTDPAIRGVFCARGGYGAQRVVDGLDLAGIGRDPKLVVGFSDITALHLALWRGARLASVHGPVLTQLTEEFPAVSVAALRTAIMSEQPVLLHREPEAETGSVTVPGPPVTGTLLGGNLCLLAASLGTPDLPPLDGAILMIEEVEEPPYKVDRMLTQLRRAGVLRGVAGIAVGQFTDCADEWPMSIVDVLLDRLGDLGVPVLGGLPFGHGEAARSVPVGVPATLDVSAGTLTVSPAVEQPR
ncbi:LD-carboxypeptidase [Rugosimonospora acidiphila]|uniref:LD-carboxypeptidase n=1 Tax=Rugosimonospora acidiphila TaxID=556531 RepID=A0ABP9RRY7_9ACTN